MPILSDDFDTTFEDDIANANVDWEQIPGLESRPRNPRVSPQPAAPSSSFPIPDDLAGESTAFFNVLDAATPSANRSKRDAKACKTNEDLSFNNDAAGPSNISNRVIPDSRNKRISGSHIPKTSNATSHEAFHPYHRDDITPSKSHNSSLLVQQMAIREAVAKTLDAMEEELTCPICCDVLASAHAGNPCGHSACGPCFQTWILKQPRAPQCASCRISLSRGTPTIPNYTIDNMVRKYIETSIENGSEAWKPGGSRRKDWEQRNEAWKEIVRKKTAIAEPLVAANPTRASRRRAPIAPIVHVIASDPDYVDESLWEEDEMDIFELLGEDEEWVQETVRAELETLMARDRLMRTMSQRRSSRRDGRERRV